MEPTSVVLWSIGVHLAVFTCFRVFLSRVMWGDVYRKLNDYERVRWDERTVALIHGAVSAAGSIRAILPLLPRWSIDMTCSIVKESDRTFDLAEFYVCVTLGYFLYDTVVYATVARHHTFADWAHHLVSAAQYCLHVKRRWAYLVPISLQTNEVSTPFLHLSWFFAKVREHGGMRGRLSDALMTGSQLTFATLFFLSRVLWDLAVAAVSMRVWLGGHCPDSVPQWAQAFSFVNLLLYVAIQNFWFATILSKIRSAFFASPKKTKSL